MIEPESSVKNLNIQIPPGYEYFILSQRGFDSVTPMKDVLDSFRKEAMLLNQQTPCSARNYLDIGSGIGFASIFLSKIRQRNNPTFFLFDKSITTENVENVEFREKHHFFYNDFECTKKLIEQPGLSPDNFEFIDAEPENLLSVPKMDVLFSFFSWGWHYHVNTYLKELRHLLKSGTVLIADIRVDAVADYDAQKNAISNIFNSCPEILKTYNGWKKSDISDPNLKKYIQNNSVDYGITKGNRGGPKGHRFKWVFQHSDK